MGRETTTTRRIETSPDTFHNFGFLVGKGVVVGAAAKENPPRDTNTQRCTAGATTVA